MIKHYSIIALVGLSIGMAFSLVRSHWPEPAEPKVIHAVYMFVWSDYAVTARTSDCGQKDSVFYCNAIDHPPGWAFFSMQNLRYGLCLDREMPESPLEIPSMGNAPLILK